MNKKNAYDEALLKLSLSSEIDSGDFTQVSKFITLYVNQVAESSRCSIWVFGENYKYLELVCLATENNFITEAIRLKAEDYPAYFNALMSDRFIQAEQAREHPSTREFCESYLLPLNIFSLLDAPIRLHGRTIAVLCLEQTEQVRQWDQSDLQLVGSVAEILARAKTSEYKYKIEKQLFDTNRRLEELVQERTEHLLKAQKQLIRSEKLASLGELVAGIAHEVNTPIGIGVTATSFLRDNLKNLKQRFEKGTLTQTEFKETIANIEESSRLLDSNLTRAANLIGSFKRIASDQSIENENYQFHFFEMINNTITSLTPKLKKKNIQIEISCPAELSIFANPGKYSQILTNLIMNSLLHGFEKCVKGKIKIQVIANTETLEMVYIDSGKGIPETKFEKVLEPFYTTKRGHGGTGLGLFIIHNLIVEDLGGNFELFQPKTNGFGFKGSFPIS